MTLCNRSQLNYFTGFVVLILLLMSAVSSEILAQESYTRLVQKIKTSELGIPNPAGMAYWRSAGAFFIAPGLNTAEIAYMSGDQLVFNTVTLTTAIPNPANMAFDDKRSCLVFFNEANEELVQLQFKADGQVETSSEGVIRYNTELFKAENLQGMTFDPETGDIFLLVVPGQLEWARIIRMAVNPLNKSEGLTVIQTIFLTSLPKSKLRGIAFNPDDGHLFVLSIADQTLFELTEQGEVVSSRDVSAFGLSNAQNMVFAPSGDQTDDPSIQSLYVLDGGNSSRRAGIIELTLIPPKPRNFSPRALNFTLVQNIHTWQWNPPSPDASGICYIPSTGHLYICDGEVEEGTWKPPIWGGANVWVRTKTNGRVREFNTLAFSEEPTDVAYNPNNQHLYFSDDTGTKSVYDLNAGADGIYGTGDDSFTSVNTGNYGSSDPEGVTYDTEQGHVFWVDGVNREVYELNLGANGILGGGDDVLIQHFDTQSLGASDPEGVEFNPDNGHLYILGSNDIIIETTRNGTYIQEASIGSFNPRKPAGLAYAPTSNNPFAKSLYIVCRGTDNDGHPTENDGEIYEITLGSFAPTLSIDDVGLLEGDNGSANAVFTVTLSSPAQNVVTVDYATADGSATTANNDYVAKTGQVIFQPGQTSRPITIVVNGDVTDEPDETFFVNLSNAVNAPIGDGQGMGTIINDDGPELMTISFQDGTNGYSGTRDTKLLSGSPTTNYGTAAFLENDGSPDISSLLYWDIGVIPSGSSVQSVDIQTNVLDVSSTAYELYELKRPWVEGQATWNQFAAGQNWQTAGANGSADRGSTVLGAITGNSLGSKTISLNAAGVAVVQSWVDNPSTNHGFIILNYVNTNGLDLSSREAATVSQRPKLTVTYVGGTPPAPSLSINDVSVTEGNSGTVNAVFAVSLSAASDQTVTVDYATANGTATEPDDYTAVSGQVSFQPGVTSQPVTVTVNGDLISEPNETFFVNLSGAVNATISDNQGIATITNDDVVLSLSINDVSVTEGNSGTVNAVFAVSLSAASAQTVTVNYATANGTATEPDDYTAVSGQVSFQPGVTSQPVTVVVNGDLISEPNETFFVNLSGAVNATISDNQGIATINDDDGGGQPVTVSFQDGVNGYTGTRDTKLLYKSPGTNYGTVTPLEVDGSPDKASLLYWDLAGVPSGSTVQSVVIQVNVLDVSPTDYELYELKRPWVEEQATWNQYAAGQNWQTAGANGSADRGSTVLAAISGNGLGSNTISLNATGVAVVQAWVNDPSSNHGFIVQNYINSNGLDFSSRETATVSQRPKLTVSYTPTASLTVTIHNDGETWRGGSIKDITWSSKGTSGTVKIEYSTDNGLNWNEIYASTNDDGSEPWTLPDITAAQVLVRISDTNGNGPEDCSDDVFTITSAQASVEAKIFLNEILEGKVVLNWTTENEPNTSGFEIYRAVEEDGDYILLSSYLTNPNLAGQGNSGTRHEYSYTDESAKPEKTYWYKLADLDYAGVRTFHVPIAVSVPASIPTAFKLHQNYPNPFNPTTTLRFDIPGGGAELVDTKLVIYNSLGQAIKTLIQDKLNPGSYEVQWDGTTDFGNGAPSGVYFVVFRADRFSQTGKLVLLK